MIKGHTNLGNAYATFRFFKKIFINYIRGGWRSDQAQQSLAGSLNSWRLDEIEVYTLS
jgi:hypothetical protein